MCCLSGMIFQDAFTDGLFPEHRRGKTGTFNIMMDLMALMIIVNAVRAYLIPLTAAAQALHDTAFGDAVKGADNEYARIEAFLTNQ